MIKPLIIFIEGQDRSGKTSLIRPIFQKTGMIHNVIDRGPLSNLVYSTMYDRDVDLNAYVDLLNNDRIVTFYLDTSISAIVKRTEESQDFNVPIKDISKHKESWLNEVSKIKNFKNVFIIDNSDITIEKTIDLIVEKINDYIEEQNYG